MAENTGIEWAHHTFNPWIGCTKVSPACDNCYAEEQNSFRKWNANGWGPRAPRRRTSTAYWKKPLKWNKEAYERGIRYRVFCASLADVFDNHRSISSDWRGDLWNLMRQTPHLDWLLLTKRPQNIKKMLPQSFALPHWGSGWENVWLGTTVENQTEADRRIPQLLSVPAEVHFLSCEPLLGPVQLTNIDAESGSSVKGMYHINALTGEHDDMCRPCKPVRRIDWVITGGESGADYRPTDDDWFRSLRNQCSATNTPFLLKQFEGRNQREIKAKGRALDGVVHDGYPDPRQRAMEAAH